MLKEEATVIKELFQNSDSDDFNTFNGWLDYWKITYSVKERRIVWTILAVFLKLYWTKCYLRKENKQGVAKNQSNV